jgi:hypothetical protein
MFLKRHRVMLNRLLFFVGVVFRIKALHLFGNAAVSVTIKVNGNEGDARRGQVRACGEDRRLGRGFLRGKYFFCSGWFVFVFHTVCPLNLGSLLSIRKVRILVQSRSAMVTVGFSHRG